VRKKKGREGEEGREGGGGRKGRKGTKGKTKQRKSLQCCSFGLEVSRHSGLLFSTSQSLLMFVP
jgi:hypothetical protein